MEKTTILTIMNGKDKGKVAEVKVGTCKVIGRALDMAALEKDMTHLDVKSNPPGFKEEEIQKINNFLKKAPSKGDVTNPYRRTSDFVLGDGNVSRIHAIVFNSDDGAGIIDLASTNGTYVNNQRVDLFMLNNGDEIKIGKTSLKVTVK